MAIGADVKGPLMCFGMNCPYEKNDGECRLRRGRPTVYPEDAACVEPEASEEVTEGAIELDPNTD